MKKKMFFQWLLETYGIDWYTWDENYSPSDGQGKEIMQEYEEYLQEP